MKRQLLLWVLLLAILSSGCCRFAPCKCGVPEVRFALQDSGSYCKGRAYGNTGVRLYDVFWKPIYETKISSSGCGVKADWIGSPTYLVFYEDSLGLADTVQVISVQTEEEDDSDCCDCPGAVTGFEYKVNGASFTGNLDEALLPF